MWLIAGRHIIEEEIMDMGMFSGIMISNVEL